MSKLEEQSRLRSACQGHIISAIQNSISFDQPFHHWLLNNFLPCEVTHNLLGQNPSERLPYYDGTRASNAKKPENSHSTRRYINKSIAENNDALYDLVLALKSSHTINLFSKIFNINLSRCFLRVEATFDHNGFYLHPHLDIKEKLLTMFIYLGNSPTHCGTDIYDAEKNLVKTIPFEHNTGYAFVPGNNTWHGFKKKNIIGIRRALMINYVTFETDWPILA